MNRKSRADEEERVGKYREFNSVEELIAGLREIPLVPFYSCPWCGLVFYPEYATDVHCL